APRADHQAARVVAGGGRAFVARARPRAVRAGAALVIRIGTRGSALALAQARSVAAGLGADAELVPMRTEGDRLAEARLAAVGGKGLFVREIEEALLRRDIDVAVHSLKDLPAEPPAGLVPGGGRAAPARSGARALPAARPRHVRAGGGAGHHRGGSAYRRPGDAGPARADRRRIDPRLRAGRARVSRPTRRLLHHADGRPRAAGPRHAAHGGDRGQRGRSPRPARQRRRPGRRRRAPRPRPRRHPAGERRRRHHQPQAEYRSSILMARVQPNHDRPLEGRTIVVTRAAAQAQRFTQLLEAAGARVLEAPAIVIAPPPSWEPLDAALASLDTYTWVIFTSVNGVAMVDRRLAARGLAWLAFTGRRVAPIR